MVIELMILGFLAEGPLHGYELRRRMEQLHGYARAISWGTLYPAISRLAKAGLVRRESEAGKASAARITLHLTDTGRRELVARLRAAEGDDITDGHRFMVVLAFLSHVPDATDRDAVLQRRLDYVGKPKSFFSEGDRPLRADEITDPYRRGIFVSARASNQAERDWLHQMLDANEP